MKSNPRLFLVPILIALNGCGDSGLPETPLFVGVEALNYSIGSQLIQERLQARFPTGSSAQRLEKYLEEQGLLIEGPNYPWVPLNSGVASLQFGSSFCGSQVQVSWAADAERKIQSIDALYSDTGCP